MKSLILSGMIEYNISDIDMYLCSSEMASGAVHVFDPEGNGEALDKFDKIHRSAISTMTFFPKLGLVVSSDIKGMVEYWNPSDGSPFNLDFDLKSETDLYEFAKKKTRPSCITASSDNEHFACMSLDRIVRIFHTRSGRLLREFDESVDRQTEIFQRKTAVEKEEEEEEEEEGDKEPMLLLDLIPVMDDVEFGRRIALEKELEKTGHLAFESVIFDEESDNFILYPTMFGIKCLEWRTGKVYNIIGRDESGQRFLNITMFQGGTGKRKNIQEAASENPVFKEEASKSQVDPLLVCTAYKKSRFYIFSNKEPNLQERDILNEKPDVETSASGKHAKKEETITNLPTKAIM